MPTAADISQRIKTLLGLSEPDLDTTIGSVAGKMADAFAVPAAEASLDDHVRRWVYDIDSKTAGDLEGFVRLFGMDRKAARYAVGVVTFGRSAVTAAQGAARIPVGTQVMSNTSPVIYVQTTASAVMSVNQTTIDVPVQAIVPGAAGNVAAGTLIQLASDVSGVATPTTNVDPMRSGRDMEADEQLRTRWKETVFRNIAGTLQMYRAMALQTSDTVTAVNVIGAKKTWVDRITIASGTSGAISFGNPEYIYPSNVFVGADLGASNLLAPKTDYVVVINNGVHPATITINAVVGGGLADGDYDISFDYVPKYSRNNPFGTRFNDNNYVNTRIDTWVNGSNPVSVSQACKFSTASSVRFSSLSTDAMYLGNFSTLDGAHPASNDIFTPLAFGPIISVPNSLTIAAVTYLEGVHYDVVHRSDAFGYAPTSQFGLLWHVSGAIPSSGDAFTIDYIYNDVPARIQQMIEGQWRLLGTDAQFHAGIAQRYRFHLAVVYERGFDTTAVNTAINLAIANWVADLGFDSSMQVSDILQQVHNVPGVDNVRFLNSTDDGTHYAIEKINVGGTTAGVLASGGRAIDVYFDDATYPLFYDTRIVVKTRTNFGTP
jgi:uncharacterized phage protein gp47/JayE